MDTINGSNHYKRRSIVSTIVNDNTSYYGEWRRMIVLTIDSVRLMIARAINVKWRRGGLDIGRKLSTPLFKIATPTRHIEKRFCGGDATIELMGTILIVIVVILFWGFSGIAVLSPLAILAALIKEVFYPSKE